LLQCFSGDITLPGGCSPPGSANVYIYIYLQAEKTTWPLLLSHPRAPILAWPVCKTKEPSILILVHPGGGSLHAWLIAATVLFSVGCRRCQLTLVACPCCPSLPAPRSDSLESPARQAVVTLSHICCEATSPMPAPRASLNMCPTPPRLPLRHRCCAYT
jgi:hypothetical protein